MLQALAMRLAAVAIIGLPVPAAPAQQAQGGFPEFSTYDLFPPDSVDPRSEVVQQIADAIRAAQAPDGCALGRLKLRTAVGDPLYQVAMLQARQAAVLQALHRLGVPVAGRLAVESTIFGDESGHDAVYESARDAQPPTLHTSSVPASGSTVKPGAVIKVTMVARDDAYPRPWQTGIKTIQLVADSEGGRFVASENHEPCADAPPPPEHRVVATYTVPPCDPPVVRLSALAEDHAALMDTDAAEFPVDRQDEDDCDHEDESRDAGGGQDSDGQACVRTWIIHGREVSFPCP
ncbi:MAG TPA: hypothetical protein VHG92_14870 [Afifellaceae bacterium]|nr:hypothetical protein [Afifellaceae bacterium]